MVNVLSEPFPTRGIPPPPWGVSALPGSELPVTRIEVRLYPLSGMMVRVTCSPAPDLALSAFTVPFAAFSTVIAYSAACVSEASGDGQAAMSGTITRANNNIIFVIFFIFSSRKKVVIPYKDEK
jgi:hypothetical protein